MKLLLEKIEAVMNSETKHIIDQRLSEFKAFKDKSSHDIFKEMCFCILTANCGAEASLKIHQAIGDGFLTMSCQEEFTDSLKKCGGRFYNNKGKFLAAACKYRDTIKDTIDTCGDERAAREWIVKNVKGLGYKEASHFLRNIGYDNVAIIDFHIVDILVDHGIIERPKALSKQRYLEIEEKLEMIGKQSGTSLAGLDLYLWYIETGKVLK